MLGGYSAVAVQAAAPRSGDVGTMVVRLRSDGQPDEQRHGAGCAAIEQAIQRLAVVVEQETASLKGHMAIDLNDFSSKKNQALLELSRAMRMLDGAAPSRGVLESLGDLRTKLDLNRAALKVHLEAVREISSILADAIRDADSDGTYLPLIRGAGRASS